MTDQNVEAFSSFDFEAFANDHALDAELDAANERNLFGGISVAVVDPDPAVREYLSGMFDGRADTAGSLVEIDTRLGLHPIVVVLGPACIRPDDLEVVERWDRTKPNVGVVLIVSELSTDLMRSAMQVGVKDVMEAPIDKDQLIETVRRVSDIVGASGPQQSPTGTDDHIGANPGSAAKVISVFSTKGGSGKSVTATNLGVVMAQQSDRPVVLVDGHLQFGDVAVMLKLQPEHTVVDAVSALGTADPAVLKALMTRHQDSGLYVLPAPLEPTFADQVTADQIVRLIELIKQFAGHVIIDLPAIFSEVVLSVIEASDEIVMVAGLDIPNIKNAKIGLSTLSLLNVPLEKIHLILNRADSKVKLDVDEVERALKVKAVARVPSNVVVPISVNRGIPVVLSAPKSGVARAFEQLALRFLDGPKSEAPQPVARRRFFG